jgi:L-aminopeptidase/D-esterase-like protein
LSVQSSFSVSSLPQPKVAAEAGGGGSTLNTARTPGHRADGRGTLIGVVVIGPFWFTRENQRVVRTRTQLALACCCTGAGGGDDGDLRLDASTRTKEKKRRVSLYIRASVPATPDHKLSSPSTWTSGRSAEAVSVRE